MNARRRVVPFREGQRFPEVRRALQEKRPVSKRAVDELIEKHRAEMMRLEGGSKAKLSYYQEAQELCRRNGRTEVMDEINKAWKEIQSPEAFRRVTKALLKKEKLL